MLTSMRPVQSSSAVVILLFICVFFSVIVDGRPSGGMSAAGERQCGPTSGLSVR